MSAILDALRKIEGERPGPAGRARAGLLVSRPQPLSPTPRYRSRLWAAGVSFLLAGLIAGAWMTRREAIPPAEGEMPHRPSKAAEPALAENSGTPEKTASTATEGQIREEQQRSESVTAPSPPEHPLVRSEPPPLQDSPFVSSPQVAQRTSLVDTTPQGFSEPGGEQADQKREVSQRRKDSVPHVSETAGEELETPRLEQEQPLASEKQTDSAEADEPEDVYDPAPANSAVSFLQWSPEAARRKAFVRVGGSPLALVREGDAIGGYTVVEIRPNAVALQSGTTRFQIRVR